MPDARRAGDQSRVFLAEDAERLVGAIPDARFSLVSGAGHTVQGDNPAGLVAALEPFLIDTTEGRS